MICLLLVLGSLLLFLPFIEFPNDYNFDEMHYAIAAKALVPPHHNLNWEHPPLAKYLIGLGIRLAGDRPIGWRLASMLFGGIAVAGMYALALAIFRERRLAFWVAALTLLNIMLFVLARTAMLEPFFFAFLVWGLACVCFAWDEGRPPAEVRRWLLAAGALFGLSAACKWVGLVPLLFLVLAFATVRLLQRFGARLFHAPPETPDPWYSAQLWPNVRWTTMAGCVLLAAALYFATFLPYLWLPGEAGTLKDIFVLQRDMVRMQSSISEQHHYASNWYQWALDWKPMWFYYRVQDGWFRGILLIGNPVVLFPGLAAAVFCVWAWWRHRSREAFLCAVWYWLLYLCFAVIPRKVSFFHYYLPAACMLSLPLAYVFRHYGGAPLFRVAWGRWAYLAVAALAFALFYSVLVGLPLPPTFTPQ